MRGCFTSESVQGGQCCDALWGKLLSASGEPSEEPLGHAISQTSHPMHELETYQQCEEGKAVCKHHIKQPPNGLMTELHFSAINSVKTLEKKQIQ